jgi:transcriptional regulator GlxA family with amidase domain
LRQVLFALLPQTVLLDVAGPADAFRIANQQVPDSYALGFVGAARSIEAAVGLRLASVRPLPRRVPPGSIIVVTGVITGALDLTSSPVRKLSEWLARVMHDESLTLMCVCSGSVIAAHAGLLGGRECTTHHSHIEDVQRLAPNAQVHANRIFVQDGRILTSAGITAGIDLALHLIGQQIDHRTAAAVAREMVVYLRRSGSDPALSPWVMHRNHIHPAVHRVQDAISRNPAVPWPAGRLAAVARTSSRNLARLFAQHAQCSPLDYVQRMRVALARELVTQSDMDLERVAERSGFSSAHQLRRVWRRWEDIPPSALRDNKATDLR